MVIKALKSDLGQSKTKFGGSITGERNIIATSGQEGVFIYESKNSVIIGNFIGNNADDALELENNKTGMEVSDSTSYNNIQKIFFVEINGLV